LQKVYANSYKNKKKLQSHFTFLSRNLIDHLKCSANQFMIEDKDAMSQSMNFHLVARFYQWHVRCIFKNVLKRLIQSK